MQNWPILVSQCFNLFKYITSAEEIYLKVVCGSLMPGGGHGGTHKER